MLKVYCYITLLFLIINFTKCQSYDKSFTIIDFKGLDKNESNYYLDSFLSNTKISMNGGHDCFNTINDTMYYVTLSSHSELLYVYNLENGNIKTIQLDSIPKYPIDFLYYHNHDSIFIFYRRVFVNNETDNTFDFILINGKGEVINTYSLNNVPYIYKGRRNYMIEYSIRSITENRIINDNLLINFSIYSPATSDPEFVDFNPKLLCLYNLSSKTFKMLNVKFPPQDIGKKFNINCWNWSYNIFYDKEQNICISFPYSSNLYKYDMALDTMILIDCRKEHTFDNVDSTARKKNVDYMDVRFDKPIWYPKGNCYIRRFSIWNYKNYPPALVLEKLDTAFNHIAYIISNKTFSEPFLLNNALQAYNKREDVSYNIELENTTKEIKWKDFEKKHLSSSTTKNTQKLTIKQYLKKLKIPKNSLVLIIDLTYPCGNCLEYLMNYMNENSEVFSKNNIYYILYENSSSSFSNTLLRNNGLLNCKSVKKDDHLLPKAFKPSDLDYRYKLIEYGDTNNVYICPFEVLVPLLDQKVEEQIKRYGN